MTDIVERLRERAEHLSDEHDALMLSAADEIERLRAERDGFYMDYRMRCDEENKAQAVEIERLRAKPAFCNISKPEMVTGTAACLIWRRRYASLFQRRGSKGGKP